MPSEHSSGGPAAESTCTKAHFIILRLKLRTALLEMRTVVSIDLIQRNNSLKRLFLTTLQTPGDTASIGGGRILWQMRRVARITSQHLFHAKRYRLPVRMILARLSLLITNRCSSFSRNVCVQPLAVNSFQAAIFLPKHKVIICSTMSSGFKAFSNIEWKRVNQGITLRRLNRF